MLGQSIIDVNVGKRGKGKLKTRFKNGFQVVIRASPEQNCHVKNVSPNLFHDSKIELSIEVTELDNDVKLLSIIIGGVMVVLITLFFVLDFVLGSVCKWTSLSGKVVEKDAESSESSASSESSEDNSSICEMNTCLDEENPSREEKDCDRRDEIDGRDIKVPRNRKKVKTTKRRRSKIQNIQCPYDHPGGETKYCQHFMNKENRVTKYARQENTIFCDVNINKMLLTSLDMSQKENKHLLTHTD